MTRDRFPQPLGHDYVRPADRVPSEPASLSTVLLWTALSGGMFILFLSALPDLAVWVSTWNWPK